jgi:soluble P-type ATPase
MEELISLGVEVKVLTGDSVAVCRKVCQQINLPVKSIVTTEDLNGLDDEQIVKVAHRATVFAKLTPFQESLVIRALKRSDHVVGFLGDGINDAPALVEADVGISVDTATDIAKESTDVILLEKITCHHRRCCCVGSHNLWQYDEVHCDNHLLQLWQRLFSPGRILVAALFADASDPDSDTNPALRSLSSDHSLGSHG